MGNRTGPFWSYLEHGLDADRPTASSDTLGHLYYATDASVMYACVPSGSTYAWVTVSPAGSTLATDDATNTGVTRTLTLTHTTSGVPGAGIGTGMLVRVEVDDGTEDAGALDFIATDETTGSVDTAFVVRVRTADAAIAEALRVTGLAVTMPTGTDLVSGANTLVGTVTDKLNPVHLAHAAQAAGDILYADGATTMTRLASPALPSILTTPGAGAAPAWSSVVSRVMSGHVSFTNPLAAELVSIVADVGIADGAQILAAQPPVPSKLQVRITDGDNSVTGSVVLVGVGARGQAVTQTIPLTGGTRTVITTDAYATVTSITVGSSAGVGVGDNISVGVGAALGLPGAQAGTGFGVYRAYVDGVAETVGTVDATAGTIEPNTAANGAHDYEFWFTYTLPLT